MEKILLKTNPSKQFSHFVHYMQYLYWCSDIILNDTNFEYIIIEPTNKSNSDYIKTYLIKLVKYSLLKHAVKISIKNNYSGNDICKVYTYSWERKQGNFILNNIPTSGYYLNWFPNNNSEKIRDLFLDKKDNNKNIKVGILNRKGNRILTNSKKLRDEIRNKFNLEVESTYFEDKPFKYQISFFNKHNIIITPHGAQLCSTPFSQDDTLIIECVHEEWHPYFYFPGLSYTSNKYHAMICNDHSVFPTGWSKRFLDKKLNKSRNLRLNIKVDISKVIDIIDIYLKNNKLESRECYLL